MGRRQHNVARRRSWRRARLVPRLHGFLKSPSPGRSFHRKIAGMISSTNMGTNDSVTVTASVYGADDGTGAHQGRGLVAIGGGGAWWLLEGAGPGGGWGGAEAWRGWGRSVRCCRCCCSAQVRREDPGGQGGSLWAFTVPRPLLPHWALWLLGHALFPHSFRGSCATPLSFLPVGQGPSTRPAGPRPLLLLVWVAAGPRPFPPLGKGHTLCPPVCSPLLPPEVQGELGGAGPPRHRSGPPGAAGSQPGADAPGWQGGSSWAESPGEGASLQRHGGRARGAGADLPLPCLPWTQGYQSLAVRSSLVAEPRALLRGWDLELICLLWPEAQN